MVKCDANCEDDLKVGVSTGEKKLFLASTKVCIAARYMGLSREYEPYNFEVKIHDKSKMHFELLVDEKAA